MHEGENKMHDGVNNMWRWEIRDHGENYEAQKLRRKRVKGRSKGCIKC